MGRLGGAPQGPCDPVGDQEAEQDRHRGGREQGQHRAADGLVGHGQGVGAPLDQDDPALGRAARLDEHRPPVHVPAQGDGPVDQEPQAFAVGEGAGPATDRAARSGPGPR